jgi:integrase
VSAPSNAVAPKAVAPASKTVVSAPSNAVAPRPAKAPLPVVPLASPKSKQPASRVTQPPSPAPAGKAAPASSSSAAAAARAPPASKQQGGPKSAGARGETTRRATDDAIAAAVLAAHANAALTASVAGPVPVVPLQQRPPPYGSMPPPTTDLQVPRGCHTQAPAVVALTGGWLRRLQWRAEPAADFGRLVWDAYSQPVHSRHMRMLHRLAQSIPASWESVPLGTCLLEFIQHESSTRGWQPQTLFREMCNLCGAFAALSLYAVWPGFGVRLSDLPDWTAAMKTARGDSEKAQPHHQTACSAEDIMSAVMSEPCESTALALLLQWLTAARPGCILKLRKDCIELLPNLGLRVTFRDGKGVAFRGPYTVHTRWPEAFQDLLHRRLQSCASPSEVLIQPRAGNHWAGRMPAMLASLRAVNPELNLRAVRRGALQALAMAGTDTATLMQYSGHTNERTLKRYLDWGRLHQMSEDAGQSAAAAALG